MRVASLDCNSCSAHSKSAFCDIPQENLDELGKNRIVNSYKTGQTIFYEGNRAYGVYCINKGKVKLYKSGEDGKNLIVKISQAGDLFGYRALFTNESYFLTAEVIEDATICFIDKERFSSLIKNCPSFSLKLLELMGLDIKCVEEKSRNFAFKTTQERIIELMFSLKDAYGTEQDNGTYKLDILLSREDLAGIMGASTETTVRLLTWLKEKGIIETRQKYIYINNMHDLEEMVPHY